MSLVLPSPSMKMANMMNSCKRPTPEIHRINGTFEKMTYDDDKIEVMKNAAPMNSSNINIADTTDLTHFKVGLLFPPLLLPLLLFSNFAFSDYFLLLSPHFISSYLFSSIFVFFFVLSFFSFFLFFIFFLLRHLIFLLLYLTSFLFSSFSFFSSILSFFSSSFSSTFHSFILIH